MSSDLLDQQLAKLNQGSRGHQISEELKARLREKCPKDKKQQIGWLLRQLETVKDIFLDNVDSNKNLKIQWLVQCRSTLVSIRDTIYLRDNKSKGSIGDTGRGNPLKGMLTAEQELQISKARKAKNGAANEEETEDT